MKKTSNTKLSNKIDELSTFNPLQKDSWLNRNRYFISFSYWKVWVNRTILYTDFRAINTKNSKVCVNLTIPFTNFRSIYTKNSNVCTNCPILYTNFWAIYTKNLKVATNFWMTLCWKKVLNTFFIITLLIQQA